MSSVTWTCPRCGRRVPNRAPACHCGTTQEQARQESAPPAGPSPGPRPRRRAFPWREIWKDLTWDLKALALGVALVAILGLVWLLVPHKAEPIVPVLGIVAPAPTSPPSPTSTPASRPKGR